MADHHIPRFHTAVPANPFVPANPLVQALKARVASVQQAPLLCGLSLDACTEVVSLATELRFHRHKTIFREGTSVHFIPLLASGRVKLTQLSHDGIEVTLWIKQSGETLDGLGLPRGGVHGLTAKALDPCRVLAWENQRFEALAERFPALRRNTAGILAEHLHMLEERFLELATEQVPSRLARLLKRLLKSNGTTDAARIDLSQQELAQMIGTSVFTVSRLLCKWQERGIIQTRRNAILVHNRPGLIDLAECVGGWLAHHGARIRVLRIVIGN